MARSHGLLTLAVLALVQSPTANVLAQRVHTRVSDAEQVAQQSGRPILAIAGAKT
ncbi:MAG: hypothetical protein ABGZ17_24175 [Planctomycetaceae bacterium]